MRKLHRWISTVGMVVLFYVVVTGTVLAVDEFIEPSTFAVRFADSAGQGQAGMSGGMAAGMEGMPMPTAAKLPTDQLEAMAATVVNAALVAVPDTSLQTIRVRLQMQGEQVQGVVTLAGAQSQTLAFDAITGAQIAVPLTGMAAGMGGGMQAGGEGGRQLSLNTLLQSIHSGAIVGSGGQWLILATGCSLVVLAVSGIWMFFQLLMARSKRGRKAWFWR